jgi:hypothetical protein
LKICSITQVCLQLTASLREIIYFSGEILAPWGHVWCGLAVKFGPSHFVWGIWPFFLFVFWTCQNSGWITGLTLNFTEYTPRAFLPQNENLHFSRWRKGCRNTGWTSVFRVGASGGLEGSRGFGDFSNKSIGQSNNP